jgi:hypothetical protein
MRLRRPPLVVAVSTLLLVIGSTCGAEVYKWVDENGVTNYGSAPPPDRKARQLPKDAPGLTIVPATPPPAASAAASGKDGNSTDDRIDRLERELELERARRASASEAAADERRAAIERCEANRGIDCDIDPYQAFNRAPAVVIHPLHRVPNAKPFRPMRPDPPASPGRERNREPEPREARVRN